MIRVEPIKTKQLLDEAHRIRKQVFVIEQKCPEDIEWEYEDESHHYIALHDGLPVGTARWRETDKGIKFERFAVLEQYRNKEVGKALLTTLLSDTEIFNRKRYLHAQIEAKNFYLKNGFAAKGEHFWEAGIEHVTMEY